MNPDAAIRAFDGHREDYLKELLSFLRFETISAQQAHADDIRACAKWVRQQLADAGLNAEVVPTAGHPVVLADTGPAENATTLLFYGHYDVQPVGDANLWTSPAFDPQIRDGIIFARGSADDKGQVMTHLAAMRSWRAANDKWPVRIKFLIEGEEEVGSPNLPDFVRQHRDRLACDYVVLSDTGKFDADTPALAYSTRGLVYKEITIDGPSKDLHSGHYGGAVANPGNVLARIIASLHDSHHRVTIPGFYDDVLPLSPEERRRLAEHSTSDADLLASTGSSAPAGEEGFTTTERCTARPTLDVNGLVGGYIGEGSSTIIPARARAKVSMRLVPNQNPEKISQAFDAAVQRAAIGAAACRSGGADTAATRGGSVRVKIETFADCAAYVAPTDSPGMRSAAAAMAVGYGREPVLIREGGTLPILPMFKQVLGADSLMLGFADPNSNLHSPNEFFHVRDFEIGTRCIIHFISNMGR